MVPTATEAPAESTETVSPAMTRAEPPGSAVWPLMITAGRVVGVDAAAELPSGLPRWAGSAGLLGLPPWFAAGLLPVPGLLGGLPEGESSPGLLFAGGGGATAPPEP